ncbi:MAG: tetratricopeptide repeat protein [bacterium]
MKRQNLYDRQTGISYLLQKSKGLLRGKRFIHILAIIILGIIVYVNSFRNEFVYDDIPIIEKNPYIKNWKYIPKIFTTDIFCMKDDPSHRNNKNTNHYYYYRPFQSISNMLDYYLWRLNPTGYHFSNLLWHLLTAVLVYFFVNLISRTPRVSLITGLLFVVHPLHTEAVAYISGRTDLMVSSFILLTLILFIKYRQTSSIETGFNLRNQKKYYYYTGAIFSFIFALLSKETAVMLPFILVLYDYSLGLNINVLTLREKIKNNYSFLFLYAPFFLGTLLYILLRIYVLTFGNWPSGKINFYLRLLTTCKSIVLYLKLLFLPFGLYMDRILTITTSIFDPAVLVFIIIGIGVIMAYKYNRIVFFGALWFLLFFIPTSHLIVPLPRGMLEHWIYLPSIGFFMILATGIDKTLRLPFTTGFKNIIKFFIAAVILMYAGLTIRQNNIWKNQITLFQNILKYNSFCPETYNNLGNIYAQKGLLDEAIQEYKKALILNPDSPDIHNNLGDVYERKGLLDEAIQKYKKTLMLNPNTPGIHNNFGNIYTKKGLFEEAIQEYKKELILNPNFPEIHNNLGNIYAQKGLFDEAIQEYKKALILNPDSPEIHNNLGDVYERKGLFDKAINESKEAIKLKPDLAEAYNTLGNAYRAKGAIDSAIYEYNKALTIDSTCEASRKNLEYLQRLKTK